jgi:hypothetical protein
METENWWSIIGWHLVDVLHESSVLSGIWNVVVEVGNQLVEAVVWSEDLLLDPELGIASEHFSIKTICDLTSVLHIRDHVLDGFP